MACLIIVRSSRVGHPSVAIRSVVAVWRRWSFLINLAAQCCNFSRCLIWVMVSGFHIGEAYSCFGRTSMLQTVSFTSGLHDSRVRLIIPKHFDHLEAMSVT